MIICARCRYFCPDTINPAAGMGRCMHDARHGYFYPEQQHSCRDHEPKENARGQSPQRTAR